MLHMAHARFAKKEHRSKRPSRTGGVDSPGKGVSGTSRQNPPRVDNRSDTGEVTKGEMNLSSVLVLIVSLLSFSYLLPTYVRAVRVK